MSKATDQIIAIIQTKGYDLRSDDIDEIHYLMTDIPLDDLPDEYPMIMGALANIVNDPVYDGDIEPVE
ncbi:hypothetical protein [Sphingobium sp. Leaf26]|uniref:hypothetical protein n=1 Tax=Sphingobium sp. Leaf26 TaxID=1735693 RepID=UPI0012E0ED1F|nr:hypothetical protein [Sphingobium sp. Leaf26]